MDHKSVSRQATIRINQNDLLYSGIKFTAIASIAAGFVAVWTLADRQNLWPAVLWLSLLLPVYLFRLYDSRQYRLSTTRTTRVNYWHWRFSVATYGAAAAWASSIWLIFPDQPAYQVLHVLTLGAVAAGALASLPYDRTVTLWFQIIIAATVEARLLLAGDVFSFEIALFGLFVFGFLLSCGREVSRNYFDLLCLRQDIQENNLMLIDTTERMAQMGYWQWDTVSPSVSVSENLARMLGVNSQSLPLRYIRKFIHPDDLQRFDQAIEQASDSENEIAIEFRLMSHADEDARIINQVVARVTDSHGKQQLLGTVQDITQMRSAERKIYDMAYYDELTGLANRAHFREQMQGYMTAGEGKPQKMALVFIDLDDFKGVNDSYGHDCGDKYLIRFAEYLQQVVGRNTLFARLGGDEFCFVLRDVKNQQEVADVCRQCLAFSDQVVTIGNHRVHPKLSIGVTLYPEDGQSLDRLLKNADLAMYEVKQNGKHGFAVYESRMHEECEDRVRLEADLRQAIEDDQFELWYQPKVDLSTHSMSGVEALIRWHHPERGLIPPDLFINTAERVGMIKEIGEWVIAAACTQAQRWREQGLELQMAVNVSSSHFEATDFVEYVTEHVRRCNLQAGDLEIEITESTSRNPELHRSVCHRLRELGVRIAIDDFGTGYSSLSVLCELEADTLKIDRAFIAGLPDDEPSLLMIRSIVDLSLSLGYDIVAEGVETAEQQQCLQTLGCPYYQGYYFSKPVLADKIPTLTAGLRLDRAA